MSDIQYEIRGWCPSCSKPQYVTNDSRVVRAYLGQVPVIVSCSCNSDLPTKEIVASKIKAAKKPSNKMSETLSAQVALEYSPVFGNNTAHLAQCALESCKLLAEGLISPQKAASLIVDWASADLTIQDIRKFAQIVREEQKALKKPNPAKTQPGTNIKDALNAGALIKYQPTQIKGTVKGFFNIPTEKPQVYKSICWACGAAGQGLNVTCSCCGHSPGEGYWCEVCKSTAPNETCATCWERNPS